MWMPEQTFVLGVILSHLKRQTGNQRKVTSQSPDRSG